MLMLLSVALGYSQLPVTEVLNQSAYTDDSVTVPIVVRNYYKIILNGMVVTFDTSEVDYGSMASDSGLSINVFDDYVVLYNLTPLTMNDGDTLFTLTFYLKSTDSTAIRFNKTPGLCEYADSVSNVIGMADVADFFKDGYITSLSPSTSVTIGTQYWLPSNQNVGTMIKHYISSSNNDITEKYCYNNQSYFCTVYGALYSWDEAMQYVETEEARGICPVGYHIPSKDEFDTLMTYLGSTRWAFGFAGRALKAESRWDSLVGISYGIDSVDFNALPAGRKDTTGFVYRNQEVSFMTSTESGDNMYVYTLSYWDYSYRVALRPKTIGVSVRCIKD